MGTNDELRVTIDFGRMSNVDKSEFLRNMFPASAHSIACRKPVLRVAKNDADYITQPVIGDTQLLCPAYRCWRAMIKRAYCKRFQSANPTYLGVTICQEWLEFSAFRRWWMKNQVDGYHLDKDLLTDARQYSPDACVFIPAWLNGFTTDRKAMRGRLPIGVSFHKASGKYQASCRHPVTDSQQHCGLHETPVQAYWAWLRKKMEIAIELKPDMDAIDIRLFEGVKRKVEQSK